MCNYKISKTSLELLQSKKVSYLCDWLVRDNVNSQRVKKNSDYYAVVTYKKVRGKRCHHKACEGLLLLVTNITEPRKVVCIHQPHYEDDNGFNSRNSPGCNVEVRAVHFNGLMTPLQSSSQEPSEGQDHPPERKGDHSFIVKNEIKNMYKNF